MRRLVHSLLIVSACLGLLAACGDDPDNGSAAADNADPIVIGSTNFPEQLILANIYADVLEARGFEVEKRLNLGSREIVFPALESGEIDVMPEYTGALLAYLTDEEGGEHEQQDVADAVQENLPAGLVMLDISPAEDKDALVVTAETAEKHDLNSISDLQGVAENMVIGGPPELTKRADGLPGLKQVYGLKFKEFRSLDAGGPLTVGALEGGDIDIARMFTTQGIIKAKGWVVLEDDKDLVPAQNIVPVIRADAVNDDARAALNATSAALATDDLQELNRRVGVDEKAPDAVAAEWVENSGLAGGDEQ